MLLRLVLGHAELFMAAKDAFLMEQNAAGGSVHRQSMVSPYREAPESRPRDDRFCRLDETHMCSLRRAGTLCPSASVVLPVLMLSAGALCPSTSSCHALLVGSRSARHYSRPETRAGRRSATQPAAHADQKDIDNER